MAEPSCRDHFVPVPSTQYSVPGDPSSNAREDNHLLILHSRPARLLTSLILPASYQYSLWLASFSPSLLSLLPSVPLPPPPIARTSSSSSATIKTPVPSAVTRSPGRGSGRRISTR